MAARDPDLGIEALAVSGSRFGDISPAFAAACGAKVEMAFMLGARKAQARALVADARRPVEVGVRSVLPDEIATPRTLPASRVRTTIVSTPTSRR